MRICVEISTSVVVVVKPTKQTMSRFPLHKIIDQSFSHCIYIKTNNVSFKYLHMDYLISLFLKEEKQIMNKP